MTAKQLYDDLGELIKNGYGDLPVISGELRQVSDIDLEWDIHAVDEVDAYPNGFTGKVPCVAITSR